MNKKTAKDVVVGAQFNRWTVIEVNVKNPNSQAKKPPRTALCRCECGTLRYKEYRDLYSGRSQSCGCLRNEQTSQRNAEGHEIEIGSSFGKLIVIKDLGMRQQKSRNKKERWSLCQCACGAQIEVRNNNLKSGMTRSCGCIGSHGEAYIAELLTKNNISFSKQYIFNELKGVRGGALRFDFAIFKDNQLIQLIEFDGRQHTEGPDGQWKNSYSLEIIQENDRRKDLFCQKNNIKLIRIPYYDIDKINLEYLNLKNY